MIGFSETNNEQMLMTNPGSAQKTRRFVPSYTSPNSFRFLADVPTRANA